MAFGNIMLLVMPMLPLMMVGFGWLFMKNPPKSMNPFFGYNTRRSMKNQDTWDFAQRYFGKLWFVFGLVSLPISFVPLLLVVGKSERVVSITGLVVLVVQAVIMVFATIIPTERALKNHFDESGRPR